MTKDSTSQSVGGKPPTKHQATSPPVHVVRAEVLTAQAFEPFGSVIAIENGERLNIDLYGDQMIVFRCGTVDSDVPVDLLISRSSIREFVVRFLERHHKLAQTFIPLDGAPFITVVARPNAEETNGLPALDEIHAFLVPGKTAVTLRRGTWHEPPYPLTNNATRLATTHAQLTVGLQTALDAHNEIHYDDVDKRNVLERSGHLVRIGLP